MTRLDFAIDQLGKTRQYTLRLLECVPASDWFRQPKEGVTHIAWPVGHLAMAQYRLCPNGAKYDSPGQRPGNRVLRAYDWTIGCSREKTPCH